jgi:hypothetical protein
MRFILRAVFSADGHADPESFNAFLSRSDIAAALRHVSPGAARVFSVIASAHPAFDAGARAQSGFETLVGDAEAVASSSERSVPCTADPLRDVYQSHAQGLALALSSPASTAPATPLHPGALLLVVCDDTVECDNLTAAVTHGGCGICLVRIVEIVSALGILVVRVQPVGHSLRQLCTLTSQVRFRMGVAPMLADAVAGLTAGGCSDPSSGVAGIELERRVSAISAAGLVSGSAGWSLSIVDGVPPSFGRPELVAMGSADHVAACHNVRQWVVPQDVLQVGWGGAKSRVPADLSAAEPPALLPISSRFAGDRMDPSLRHWARARSPLQFGDSS